MKIANKKELKSIAEEKSRYLDYKDFLKMYNYNYCTSEPYSIITIDARPTATIIFRKNFIELPYKKLLAKNKLKFLTIKLKQIMLNITLID